MTITVVIADDEALVRSGLRLIVEADPDLEVVGEAGDGAKAVEVVREARPDVILMDVQMPIADGLEATRRIALSGVDTHVLILTTFDRDEYLYRAMKAGASGYLLKSSPPEHLVNAIRVVAAGDSLLAPSITRRLIDDYTSRPPPASAPEAFSTLTDKEGDVLLLVASGLSNSQIADQMFIAESTVKSHMNRLLAKLEARDRVQLVIAAYESGLIQPGERDTPEDAP